MACIHVGGVAAHTLLTISLSRWLGQDAFGSYAIQMSFALTLATVIGAGLPLAVLRLVPERITQGDAPSAGQTARRLWRTTLKIAALTGVPGALVTGAVCLWGLRIDYGGWSLAVLVAALLSVANYQQELARSLKRFALAYSPLRVAWPLAAAAAIPVCVVCTEARSSALALMCAALSLGLLLLAQGSRLHCLLPGSRPADSDAASDASIDHRLTRDLWWYAMITSLLASADVFVVGLALSEAEVASYYVAKRCALIAGFAQFAFNAFAAPSISELFHSGQRDELTRLLRQTAQLMLLSSACIGLAVGVGGEWVLGCFGDGYSGSLLALWLLIAAQGVNACMGAVGALLNVSGGQQAAAIIATATVVAQSIGCLVCASLWGVTGAAAAVLMATVFRTVAQTYVSIHKWGLNPMAFALPRALAVPGKV